MPASLRAWFSLACGLLASSATALEPRRPATDALDEVVVSQEQERRRQISPTTLVRDPDVVTLSREESVTAELELHERRSEILFHRSSAARRLPERTSATLRLQQDRITQAGARPILRATVELPADIDEADGLPAVLRFGPHTSLVNIDHVRLRKADNTTLYYAQNAIHPEARRCVREFGFGDASTADYASRYLLLADSMKECERKLQARENDLLVADDFPPALRQALLEVYGPVFSRISHELGSEPGQVFVAWRSDPQRNEFFFKRGWVRSGLLLFSGDALQQGLDSRQQDSLRELLVREQIERRLLQPGPNTVFMQSAVDYLALLTTAGLKRRTVRELSDRLPEWIVECAHQLDSHDDPPASRPIARPCSHVVHFVYDAAARATSSGNATVYGIWHQLLAASFARRQTGVEARAFAASSADALRIARGLMDGSVEWQKLATELEQLGVRLRITRNQAGISAQVLSLEHFRDEDGLQPRPASRP